MAYALLYDVPGNERLYRRVTEEIGDERLEGLVLHLVVKSDVGLRHIEVWDSKEDWEHFRDQRVRPAVDKVLAAAGMPGTAPPPVEHTLDLVDVRTAP
jgi:hypothetical protein